MADNKTKLPEDGSSVAAAEAALDRLAARLAEQSIGAQIRRLLPKIEKAIESGATHEEIVATLGESGISMSLATFRSALYRARKRAARDQGGSRKGSSRHRKTPGTRTRCRALRVSSQPAIRWRCHRARGPSSGTRRSGRW
jgi:ribosomal protein L19E